MILNKMNDLICRVTTTTEQARRVAFLCNECLDMCGDCVEVAKELAREAAVDADLEYSLCAIVMNSL